jgi:hypothetical protein
MTNAAMRQAIIDAISALSLDTFSVSSELPWDAAGTPLYRKNIKVFYTDEPDSTESTLINVLNGAGSLASRETTISVYVTVDAKQKPSNYDALVGSVQDVKDTSEITGVRSRECDVITTFEADLLETEFVFRFTEMIIN